MDSLSNHTTTSPIQMVILDKNFIKTCTSTTMTDEFVQYPDFNFQAVENITMIWLELLRFLTAVVLINILYLNITFDDFRGFFTTLYPNQDSLYLDDLSDNDDDNMIVLDTKNGDEDYQDSLDRSVYSVHDSETDNDDCKQVLVVGDIVKFKFDSRGRCLPIFTIDDPKRSISTYGKQPLEPIEDELYVISRIDNIIPNLKGITNRRNNTINHTNNTHLHLLPLGDLPYSENAMRIFWYVNLDKFAICQHEDGAIKDRLEAFHVIGHDERFNNIDESSCQDVYHEEPTKFVPDPYWWGQTKDENSDDNTYEPSNSDESYIDYEYNSGSDKDDYPPYLNDYCYTFGDSNFNDGDY